MFLYVLDLSSNLKGIELTICIQDGLKDSFKSRITAEFLQCCYLDATENVPPCFGAWGNYSEACISMMAGAESQFGKIMCQFARDGFCGTFPQNPFGNNFKIEWDPAVMNLKFISGRSSEKISYEMNVFDRKGQAVGGSVVWSVARGRAFASAI